LAKSAGKALNEEEAMVQRANLLRKELQGVEAV
jgi:hypothetical protein